MIQKTLSTFASIALLTLLSINTVQAQEFGAGGLGDLIPKKSTSSSSGDPVTLEAYFKVKPETNLGKVYVEATIERGWHLYSMTQPKGGPMKSELMVDSADDFEMIGPWKPDSEPHVEFSDVFEVNVESYSRQVVWSAPVEFSDGVDASQVEISMRYKGQTCVDDGTCIPLSETLTASYDSDPETTDIERSEIMGEHGSDSEHVGEKAPDTPKQLADLAALYDPTVPIKYEKLDGSTGVGTFWAALIGAFLGGMILNLMPCVFPVLGIKLLGFVEQAGHDSSKIKKHGLAFAGGLIFSMWVLAGAILAVKYGVGKDVNWGAQMGNSYFVGGIVILLFVLGLNLAGVFEMGLFMTRAGSKGKKSGYTGSFVSGIITTLVATPCSGPFLGTAMGYTLVQPPAIAMFLFTVFGLGIAFPYLALSFFPRYINMLPKPGEWMETFKKFMAFTLFAAAAFFVKSFGAQTGNDGLSWFLMALCVIALAAFFYGKWSSALTPKRPRIIWGWVAPVVISALGIWMYVDAAQTVAPKTVAENDHWELWVPGRVESLLAEGKPVWVDYTADW